MGEAYPIYHSHPAVNSRSAKSLERVSYVRVQVYVKVYYFCREPKHFFFSIITEPQDE